MKSRNSVPKRYPKWVKNFGEELIRKPVRTRTWRCRYCNRRLYVFEFGKLVNLEEFKKAFEVFVKKYRIEYLFVLCLYFHQRTKTRIVMMRGGFEIIHYCLGCCWQEENSADKIWSFHNHPDSAYPRTVDLYGFCEIEKSNLNYRDEFIYGNDGWWSTREFSQWMTGQISLGRVFPSDLLFSCPREKLSVIYPLRGYNLKAIRKSFPRQQLVPPRVIIWLNQKGQLIKRKVFRPYLECNSERRPIPRRFQRKYYTFALGDVKYV